jgi:hypothetical protein
LSASGVGLSASGVGFVCIVLFAFWGFASYLTRLKQHRMPVGTNEHPDASGY